MSIGNRIAMIRKQNNLSQEAFGEMFGVSRQAISKWESDGAIPDVENLIRISRRFDVSVGWLLGIEDEKIKDDSAKDEISAILEDYLIRISQMSERCVPEYDKNAEKRDNSKKLVNIISWILIAFMLMWNVSLSGRLTDTNFRIDQLGNNLTSYKNQLFSEVESMKYDIEASKGATSHVAEFSYDYTGYDPEKNEVTTLISFIPQQIAKDAKVRVTVSGNDHSSTNDNSVYAEYDESAGRYFAKITVPVMQDMRISLTVDDGNMRMGSEMCKLDVYQQVSPSKTGLEYKINEAVELKDGKIIKGDFDFFTAAPAFENTFLGHKIKTVKTELMVYHDGKFVKSIEMQDNYGKQMQIGMSFPEFLGDITFNEGDSLHFELKMTDNYGREYTSPESVSTLVRGNLMVAYFNAPADDYYFSKTTW